MNPLPQYKTGKLTEIRVNEKLESYGLKVRKLKPDRGIDFEVSNSSNPSKDAEIQVKGRNPKKIKSFRWFQLRVQKKELEKCKNAGLPAEESWKNKVRKVDFFILDAVVPNEMWVFTQEQLFQLIKLNESHYGSRPDNIFTYEEPLKTKQKEINLEASVNGKPIIERFASCKNNFKPILDFLSNEK